MYTDNSALRYWRRAQNLSPRQIRWLAYMGMFDMEITHIAGVKNTAADALSRIAYPLLAQPDEWLSAYRADARIRAHYFDAAGELTDPYRYHHGRLWVDDRILVPARTYTR